MNNNNINIKANDTITIRHGPLSLAALSSYTDSSTGLVKLYEKYCKHSLKGVAAVVWTMVVPLTQQEDLTWYAVPPCSICIAPAYPTASREKSLDQGHFSAPLATWMRTCSWVTGEGASSGSGTDVWSVLAAHTRKQGQPTFPLSTQIIAKFIAKWLIERAGNLPEPWVIFSSVRTKLMMKCDWKVYKSLLYLIWTVFVLILSPPVSKTFWRRDVLVRSCQWWTPCRRLHWRVQLQAYCTCWSEVMNTQYWWHHTVKFRWMKYWQIALKTTNPPK